MSLWLNVRREAAGQTATAPACKARGRGEAGSSRGVAIFEWANSSARQRQVQQHEHEDCKWFELRTSNWDHMLSVSRPSDSLRLDWTRSDSIGLTSLSIFASASLSLEGYISRAVWPVVSLWFPERIVSSFSSPLYHTCHPCICAYLDDALALDLAMVGPEDGQTKSVEYAAAHRKMVCRAKPAPLV